MDVSYMIKGNQPQEMHKRPCLPPKELGFCSVGNKDVLKQKNKMINLFSGRVTRWRMDCKGERPEGGRLGAYGDKKLI